MCRINGQRHYHVEWTEEEKEEELDDLLPLHLEDKDFINLM